MFWRLLPTLAALLFMLVVDSPKSRRDRRGREMENGVAIIKGLDDHTQVIADKIRI